MNQLAYNQDGLSKAKTLMRYIPETVGMEDWNVLYVIAESRLTAFSRLVFTLATEDSRIDIIFVRVGDSKRFAKFKPRDGSPDIPNTWRNGRAGNSFNMLYIPKSHAWANMKQINLVVNYSGASPIPDSIAEHKKSQRDKKKDLQLVAKHSKAVAYKQGILEALAAAQEAAEKQVKKVEERREVALVDSFTGNHVGGLKDDCGGAWITGIDARGGFGLAFKKLAQSDRRLFYGDKRQSGVHVSGSQYVSVAAAAAKAFVRIINEKFSLELYVRRYTD